MVDVDYDDFDLKVELIQPSIARPMKSPDAHVESLAM